MRKINTFLSPLYGFASVAIMFALAGAFDPGAAGQIIRAFWATL